MRKTVLIIIFTLCFFINNILSQCDAKIGVNSGSNLTGCGYPMAIQFNSTSSTGVQSLIWDFRDGSTSTTNHPLHEFYADTVNKTDANYWVLLTVNCAGGLKDKDSVFVTAYKVPKVSYTVDTVKACQLVDSICFINTSDNFAGYSHLWNFGSGEVASTEYSPCHFFQLSGFKSPRLRVESNLGCYKELTKTDLLEIYPVPNPQFTVNPLIGCNPLTISILNTTNNPSQITAWEWNWGDGNINTSASPSNYTYINSGLFSIELTAQNINGCINKSQQTIVSKQTPYAKIFNDKEQTCALSNIRFYHDTIKYPGANYTWNFNNQFDKSSIGDSIFDVKWNIGGQKTIILNVELDGCLATDTQYIYVHPLSTVHMEIIGNNTNLCYKDTLTLLATPTYYSKYEFYVNGSIVQSNASNTYISNSFNNNDKVFLRAIDRNNCPSATIEDTVVLSLYSLPVINISADPNDAIICNGDTLELNAVPTGYEKYIFYDGFNAIQNGPGTTVIDYNKASGNAIKVKAIDINGCESDTSLSNSYILPQINESLKTPIVNCGTTTTNSIEFKWDAIVDATGYEISVDGAPYVPSNGATSHTITITPNTESSVFVRALGDEPCGNSEIALNATTCKSEPCIGFNYNLTPDLIACKNENVILEISNVTIPNYTIFWESEVNPGADNYTYKATNSKTIIVSVFNNNEVGCPAVRKICNVTTIEPPIVSLADNINSSDICKGTEIKLTASPYTYDTYEFYNNYTLLQSSEIPFYNTNILGPNNNFKVRAIKNGCIGDFSDSISYNLFDPLQNTQVICGNSTTNSVQFLWEPVDDAQGYQISYATANDTIDFFSVGNTYSYQINGLTANSLVSLTVKPVGPNPCQESYEYATATCASNSCTVNNFTKSSNTSVCFGDSVTLSISNFTLSNYSISWDGGAKTNDNTFKFLPIKDTFIYVRVFNEESPECSPSTKYFNIKVTDYPNTNISLFPNYDTVCVNSTINIEATPTNYDQYIFYKNNIEVQRGNKPYYRTSNYTNNDIFKLDVINNGCLTSINDSVEILTKQPLTAPQVNCGETTDNSIEFVWDKIPKANGYIVSVNGNSYISANGDTSHTISVANDVLANISVIALGNTPCGNSASSTIWTGNPTTCKSDLCSAITFTHPLKDTICLGDSSEITINITNPVSANDYSIVWDETTENDKTTFKSSPLSKDTLSITVKNTTIPTCPVATKYTIIDVLPIPIVSLSSDKDTICPNKPIIYTGSVNSYELYRLYSGTNLIDESTSNIFTLNNIFKDTAIYMKAINANCFYNSNIINTIVINVPVVSLTSSDANNSICEEENLTFTVNNTNFETFIFRNKQVEKQNDINNTYSITNLKVTDINNVDSICAFAIDSFGCISNFTNAINTTILPKTNITLNVNNTTICENDSAIFNVLPANLANYVFLDSNNIIQQGNKSIYRNKGLSFTNSIKAIGENIYGCLSDTSNTIRVKVNPIITPNVSSEDTLICIGEPVVLNASVDTVLAGITFEWSNGLVGEEITIYPTKTQNISVYSNYNNCLSDAISIEIEVDTIFPDVNIGGSETICIGDIVQFAATGGVTYEWFPEDSVSDCCIYNPTATPNITQTFKVIAKNIACYDSAFKIIIVDLCLKDITGPIPQIITPNKDGINDRFKIPNVSYFTTNQLTIYNRWGNVVYQANPYNNEWEGKTKNGKELPNGTYYYVLQLGEGFPLHKGFVMINR